MEKRQREDGACGVATRRIRRPGVHRVLRERSRRPTIEPRFLIKVSTRKLCEVVYLSQMITL